jgi:hypothetical protein
LQSKKDRLEITLSLNQAENFFFPEAPNFRRVSTSTASGPVVPNQRSLADFTDQYSDIYELGHRIENKMLQFLS